MPSAESFDHDKVVRSLPGWAVDALAGMIQRQPLEGFTKVDFVAGESAGVWLADSRPNASIPDGSLAVKMLRGDDSYAAFEAMIVARLSSGPPPPLEIPKLIDYSSKFPGHLILSKVPGETLPNETVRGLTATEKQAFGKKIGEFVAWLPAVIDEADYRDIADESGQGMVPDRVNNIRRYGRKARSGQVADDTLAEVLTEVEDEYEARREMLEVSIVGHDDLRVDNVTFTQQDGLWRPAAVFDFGLTKLSSPERELRHILPLGTYAIEAAVAAYESASGRTLSRSLIHFWAIGQAATACAFFAEQPEIDVRRLEERVNDLVYLLPDRDWSSLNAILQTKGNDPNE